MSGRMGALSLCIKGKGTRLNVRIRDVQVCSRCRGNCIGEF